MATSAPRKFVSQAKIAHTDATTSDHWPLSFAHLPKAPTYIPKPMPNTTAPKPVGWVVKEIDYTDNLRERVGMDIPLDIAGIMKNAHRIYTDGAFLRRICYTAKDRHTREKQAVNNNTACRAEMGCSDF